MTNRTEIYKKKGKKPSQPNCCAPRDISKAIQQPSKLKLYALLRKQNSDDVGRYFSTGKQPSLKNKSIKRQLLSELFNYSENLFRAKEANIEVIVCDNFVLEDSPTVLPRRRPEENSRLCDIKNNPVSSINTKRPSYEDYLRSFEVKKEEEQLDTGNALFNRNRTSIDESEVDSFSEESFLTIQLEQKETKPNFVNLFANDWQSPKAKKSTAGTRCSFN